MFLFILFIAFNLLLMGALFALGVYQFMQVEEQRKGRKLLAGAAVDDAELRQLVLAQRHDEAVRRLMKMADVDRFTAEATLKQLEKRL